MSPFLRASRAHASLRHSHAPRPGLPFPGATLPASSTSRNSSGWGRTSRHPTQRRRGTAGLIRPARRPLPTYAPPSIYAGAAAVSAAFFASRSAFSRVSSCR